MRKRRKDSLSRDYQHKKAQLLKLKRMCDKEAVEILREAKKIHSAIMSSL